MDINDLLTHADLQGLLRFVREFGATFLQCFTGRGLVADREREMTVGPIEPAHFLYRRMTCNIDGTLPMTPLTAEGVRDAINRFFRDQRMTVLKRPTGFGLRRGESGHVELCDAKDAETAITFEVVHLASRHIVPCLRVDLGRYCEYEQWWRGGFRYSGRRGAKLLVGQNLTLTRILEGSAYADGQFGSTLEHVRAEANRLFVGHTITALRGRYDQHEESRQRVRFTQELMKARAGLEPDRGELARLRPDGVVVSYYDLPSGDGGGESDFNDRIASFCGISAERYERICSATLFERDISMNPTNFGLVEIRDVTFAIQGRSGLFIARPEQYYNDYVPCDGWTPPDGKKLRVFCIKRGRYLECSPAPPVTQERYVSINETQAIRQRVSIDYDGTVNPLAKAETVVLESRDREKQSAWNDGVIARFVSLKQVVIRQTRRVWLTTERQVVVEQPGGSTALEWQVVGGRKGEHEEVRERLLDVSIHLDADEREEVVKLETERWIATAKGQEPDGVTYKRDHTVRWEELPQEFREQYTRRWVRCACGNARYEANGETESCAACRNPETRTRYEAEKERLKRLHQGARFGIYGPFKQESWPSKKDPNKVLWVWREGKDQLFCVDPDFRLQPEETLRYWGWVATTVPLGAGVTAKQLHLGAAVNPNFESLSPEAAKEDGFSHGELAHVLALQRRFAGE